MITIPDVLYAVYQKMHLKAKDWLVHIHSLSITLIFFI